MGPTAMPTRSLGRSGLLVPALGMGCWPIGGPDVNLGLPMGWSTARDDHARAGLRAAHSSGVRLFDTADVYGHGHSERLIGELVSERGRDGLVLTSKVGYFVGTARHGYEPGHMRRQLEQTLDNLRTDHLDIYFLHHPDFGANDEWLAGAVRTMRQFREEGLIGAIGMRGPHRYAPERLRTAPDDRHDKIARFERVFREVEPDVLAVRDNLLTPSDRTDGVLRLAAEHDCGVLLNKPLAQGLLTGALLEVRDRTFGAGDHRSRKRWFQPDAVPVMAEGLRELLHIGGGDEDAIVRLALWSCLVRSDRAAVLVGFTTEAQVRQNLRAVRLRPSDEQIAGARVAMARVQQRLDAAGEVFVDEPAAARR